MSGHIGKRTNHRGYTLVEMMVVVAIIGILVVIAVPSYAYFMEKADLVQARTELVAMKQTLVREKIKGNLHGDGIQTVVTAFANNMNARVRQRYNFQVRCGLAAQTCQREETSGTYFLFVTPKADSARKKALWSSNAGSIYECADKASIQTGNTLLPVTDSSKCRI